MILGVPPVLLLVSFVVFIEAATTPAQDEKITYTFSEFPYKESSKNEAMFQEYEATCERGCTASVGISKILCIRQCVSPTCYKDIYLNDLLEEGEVDVRLNSFKGCFIQRYNRSRP